MSTYSGDFLGFQLGDYHSSMLNIIRTSTNDRYLENLTPNFQDLTSAVIGVDGNYYWGTNYTQKIFTIDFAFDDLHDIDIQQLKMVLNFKGLQPLIFDETPYKKYMVKCAAAPTLKYICFTDHETCIYKGEGSIQLVSFYPFGLGTLERNITFNSKGGLVNNVGELECNVSLTYNINELNEENTIQLKQNDKVIGLLKLKPIVAYSGDSYIQINSYTNLIEGLDSSFKKTGKLYNKFIDSGDFFKLPVGMSYLFSQKEFVSGKYTPLYF